MASTFSRLFRSVVGPMLLVSALGQVCAQGPRPRLAGPIDASRRATLPGSQPPRARAGIDLGAVPGGTALNGITLVFNRTAAQQAQIDALLAAQQDPTSPEYHQWLTPDQFAARFGVADADLEKVQSWLEQSGFTVAGISRAHDRITFSGTAAQVDQAFGTELHHYLVDGRTHMAPSGDLSLPASLEPDVAAVMHLSDFRLKRQTRLRPALTSANTQGHYLTPGDVATMYDLAGTYSAGYNGTGQTIAILGESYVNLSSVATFRSLSGLSTNTPSLFLVPSSGVSEYSPLTPGDEGESELDLEYAGGTAPGANLVFVYTGNNPNYDVTDSLVYAVNESLAPVVSLSYGGCETGVSATTANQYNQIVQQANLQGQTLLFSSGDDGSTSCYPFTNFTTAQRQALVVGFPASIPGVTAVGGTQMQSGTYTAGNTTYWKSASGSDVVSSLLSYVPETVWNEDSTQYGLGSGGGGVSALYPRPAWQANVTGIPSGTTRVVPDVSLLSGAGTPGYVICTADPSDLAGEGLSDSCTNGFRSSSGYLFVIGGTSVAAPVMAGMVAVLNQATQSTGLGNINTTLYGLASNSTTYASVFHDITTGTNACTAGTTYCSTAGASAYAAGTGYDAATGLGSVDFGKLLAAWPANTAASKIVPTLKLSAATLTPSSGASDVISISVTGSSATPTGSVAVSADGGTATNVALVNGAATFTWPGSATGGSHSLVATYSGDSVYTAAKGTLTLTIAGTSTATGTFNLTASAVSIPYNGTANGTVAVAPLTGFTGSVNFSLSATSSVPTLCYSIDPVAAYSGAPAASLSTTLYLGEGTACTSTGSSIRTGNGANLHIIPGSGKAALKPSQAPFRKHPAELALAGTLAAALLAGTRRRGRRLPAILGVAILGMGFVGLNGCGGNGSSTTGTTTTTNTTATYTLIVTGTDTVNTTITNTATFTLTVHP